MTTDARPTKQDLADHKRRLDEYAIYHDGDENTDAPYIDGTRPSINKQIAQQNERFGQLAERLEQGGKLAPYDNTYPDRANMLSAGTNGLSTGDRVVVWSDESQNQRATIYRVSGSSFVYVAPLNYENPHPVYYVDPLNGSDSNGGLTTTSALKSLHRAVELVPEHSGADIKLFNSNETNEDGAPKYEEVIDSSLIIRNKTINIAPYHITAGDFIPKIRATCERPFILINSNLTSITNSTASSAGLQVTTEGDCRYVFTVYGECNVSFGGFYPTRFIINPNEDVPQTFLFYQSYQSMGTSNVYLGKLRVSINQDKDIFLHGKNQSGNAFFKLYQAPQITSQFADKFVLPTTRVNDLYHGQ